MDKFLEVTSEYNIINKSISVGGLDTDLLAEKAMIVGKMEMLEWIITTIREN